jgi:hypothetical protein
MKMYYKEIIISAYKHFGIINVVMINVIVIIVTFIIYGMIYVIRWCPQRGHQDAKQIMCIAYDIRKKYTYIYKYYNKKETYRRHRSICPPCRGNKIKYPVLCINSNDFKFGINEFKV